MIYCSSLDTTNIPKKVDYIFSLMDKIVEEVGEENIIQVVTDKEASFKAAGTLLIRSASICSSLLMQGIVLI